MDSENSDYTDSSRSDSDSDFTASEPTAAWPTRSKKRRAAPVAPVTDTPKHSPQRKRDSSSQKTARRLQYDYDDDDDDDDEYIKKKPRISTFWTASQNRYLLESIAGWQSEELDWDSIAEYLPGRSPEDARTHWERACEKYANMLAKQYDVNPATINLLSQQWNDGTQGLVTRLDPNINKDQLFGVLCQQEVKRQSPASISPARSQSRQRSAGRSKKRPRSAGKNKARSTSSVATTKSSRETVGDIIRSGQRIVTIKVEMIDEDEQRSSSRRSFDSSGEAREVTRSNVEQSASIDRSQGTGRKNHDELSYSSGEGQNLRRSRDSAGNDRGDEEEDEDDENNDAAVPDESVHESTHSTPPQSDIDSRMTNQVGDSPEDPGVPNESVNDSTHSATPQADTESRMTQGDISEKSESTPNESVNRRTHSDHPQNDGDSREANDVAGSPEGASVPGESVNDSMVSAPAQSETYSEVTSADNSSPKGVEVPNESLANDKEEVNGKGSGSNPSQHDQPATVDLTQTNKSEEKPAGRHKGEHQDKQAKNSGSGLRTLISAQDKKGLSDFVIVIMEQLLACQAAKNVKDATGSTVGSGSFGLVCCHCKGQGGTDSRYFPPSVEEVGDAPEIFRKHLMNCKQVPNHIVDAVEASYVREADQLATLPAGSNEQYFARIWDRLNKRVKHRSVDSQENPPEKNSTPASADGAVPVSKDDENQEEEQIAIRRGRPRKARPKPQQKDKTPRPSPTGVLDTLGIGLASKSTESSVPTAPVKLAGEPEKFGLHGQNEFLDIFEKTDKLVLSDFVVAVMEQTVACWAGDEEAQRRTKPRIKKGFPGLLCKHCFGNSRASTEGKYFPTKLETFCQAPVYFRKHLEVCRSAPRELKEHIRRCHEKRSVQMKHMKKEVEIDYFSRFWDRLQTMKLTVDDDEESSSDRESDGSESGKEVESEEQNRSIDKDVDASAQEVDEKHSGGEVDNNDEEEGVKDEGQSGGEAEEVENGKHSDEEAGEDDEMEEAQNVEGESEKEGDNDDNLRDEDDASAGNESANDTDDDESEEESKERPTTRSQSRLANRVRKSTRNAKRRRLF